MGENARVDENCDFQQIALPLNLSIGDHVLQRIHIDTDRGQGVWHELYLVVTPNGFLIEKHSGSSKEVGRLKETWFCPALPEAKRKYSQIFSCNLSNKCRSPRKDKVVNNEKEKQQKLFS